MMFTRVVFLFFLGLSGLLASCNNDRAASGVEEVVQENDDAEVPDTVVYEYLKKPDSLYEAGQYDSAIFYYERAAEFFLANSDSANYLRSLNQKAWSKIVLTHNEAAIRDLMKIPIGRFATSRSKKFKEQVVKYYYNLGVAYGYINKPDSAESYYLKSLNIYEKDGLTSRSIIDVFMGLGSVYCFHFHDYKNGQNYFEKALEQINSAQDSTSNNILFRCYYYLSANNYYRKNLDKADYYAKGALKVAEKLNISIYKQYSYNLLASIYESKGILDASLDSYQKVIGLLTTESDKNNKVFLVQCYNNIALLHKQKEEYKTALQKFQLALEVMEKHDINLPSLKAEILANAGNTFVEMGDFKEAFKYLSASQKICVTLEEKHHNCIVLMYNSLADYYSVNGHFKEAVEYFVKTLNSLSKIEEGSESYKDPLKAIEILNSTGSAYVSLYHKDSAQIEYLQKALDCFVLADSLLDEHRNSRLLESDEIFLSNEMQDKYDEALECLKLLYHEEPKGELVRAGYKFIEQNKARILMKSIKKAESLEHIGVPDSLIQNWNDLEQQIAFWQLQRNDTNGSDQRLFELIKKQELLSRFFEENYQAYHKYRIRNETGSLLDILVQKSQLEKSVILSFFQGKNTVTVLAVRPDSTFLYFLPSSETFINEIIDYQTLLANGNPASKHQFQKFVKTSSSLYQILLAPAFEKCKDKISKLYLVTDRLLSTIAFEALITKVPRDTTKINYKDLPYLIQDFEVSYSYSLRFLTSQDEKTREENKFSLGGWGYSRLNFSNAKNTEISKATDELREISKLFDASKLFLDEDASEASFKSQADKFSVLHLSLHGASSKEGQPCLYFNPDVNNDGMLYPFELYNLKLKTKMAVLSACETGLGNLQPGEGIYSIARGFFYAGCESMIINLWEAKDLETKQIQTSFYQNLNEGYGKAVALQNAKLNYLEGSDNFRAHPNFWANPILIGSTEPVFQNSQQHFPTKTITAIILFFVAVIVLRKDYFIRRYKKIFGK